MKGKEFHVVCDFRWSWALSVNFNEPLLQRSLSDDAMFPNYGSFTLASENGKLGRSVRRPSEAVD